MSNKFKGKRIDHEFVSQFIEQCLNEGKTTQQQIVEEAISRLKKIDIKLLKINDLKLQRVKLLSVLESFDETIDK